VDTGDKMAIHVLRSGYSCGAFFVALFAIPKAEMAMIKGILKKHGKFSPG